MDSCLPLSRPFLAKRPKNSSVTQHLYVSSRTLQQLLLSIHQRVSCPFIHTAWIKYMIFANFLISINKHTRTEQQFLHEESHQLLNTSTAFRTDVQPVSTRDTSDEMATRNQCQLTWTSPTDDAESQIIRSCCCWWFRTSVRRCFVIRRWIVRLRWLHFVSTDREMRF